MNYVEPASQPMRYDFARDEMVPVTSEWAAQMTCDCIELNDELRALRAVVAAMKAGYTSVSDALDAANEEVDRLKAEAILLRSANAAFCAMAGFREVESVSIALSRALSAQALPLNGWARED